MPFAKLKHGLFKLESFILEKNPFPFMHGRGVVDMGSMGSAEPIIFQRKVLKPINFWANLVKIRHFETDEW